jgi:SAM-dependent methyltransferase
VDAATWDARYRDRELVWGAGPNALFAAETAELPPGRMLDLAGGEGRNAIHLAERGWDAELVEFSEVALGKARELAAARGVTIATTLADVTAAPALAPADLVLVCYLQVPAAPYAAAVGHAASLVAPGGTLLVIVHDRDNLARGVGGPPDAAVLPTVADTLAAIDGRSLEVVRAEQVLRRVETPEGPRDAIDHVVRAARPG